MTCPGPSLVSGSKRCPENRGQCLLPHSGIGFSLKIRNESKRNSRIQSGSSFMSEIWLTISSSIPLRALKTAVVFVLEVVFVNVRSAKLVRFGNIVLGNIGRHVFNRESLRRSSDRLPALVQTWNRNETCSMLIRQLLLLRR